jgi:hypothetical protein
MSAMEAMQNLHLFWRLLLEFCALIALNYWGFRVGRGWRMKIVLGIGVPLIIAVIWATFGSPGSSMEFAVILHLIVEVLVFGLPALVLYALGKRKLFFPAEKEYLKKMDKA